MNNQIKAKELFLDAYNCSQSTLGVFSEKFKIPFHLAVNLASGFGAGMSYQGKTCGAVTGAYMVIGLLSGEKFNEPEMVKENAYQLITKFNKHFISKFGSVNCNEILNIDISTPEGLEEGREKELFTKKCPLIVQEAVAFIDKELNT